MSADAVAAAAAAAAATAAEGRQSFPYVLTFTHPHRLNPREGGHDIFAIIGDGEAECIVLEWPNRSLPFALTQESVLSVQVFSARDSSAFQRGEREPLAECSLPLCKLAELARASTQVPFTVNLALDLQGEQATPHGVQVLIERFEQRLKAASNSPMRPKICVIVEHQQSDGIGTSLPTVSARGEASVLAVAAAAAAKAATASGGRVPHLALGGLRWPTSGEMSPRPFLDSWPCASNTTHSSDGEHSFGLDGAKSLVRALGMQPRVMCSTSAASAPATSLQIAVDNGAAPPTRATRSKSETLVPAIAANYNVPTGATEEAPVLSSWHSATRNASGSLQMASAGTPDTDVSASGAAPTLTAAAKCSATSPCAPPPRPVVAKVPHGPRTLSTTVAPSALSPRTTQATSPKVSLTSPRSQRDGMTPTTQSPELINFTVTWQTRYTEECARIERLAIDFERAKKRVEHQKQRKVDGLERVAVLLTNLGEERMARQHFDTWVHWMTVEKDVRQLDQLAEESHHLRAEHECEKYRASLTLEAHSQQLSLDIDKFKQRLAFEVSASHALEAFWERQAIVHLLSITIALWCCHVARLHALRRFCVGIAKSVRFEGLRRVMGMWSAQVMHSTRAVLSSKLASREGEVPKRLHSETKKYFLVKLEWELNKRERDAKATLLPAVMRAWLRTSHSNSRWHSGVLRLLGVPALGATDPMLTRRCVAAWVCEARSSRMASALSAQRAACLQRVSRLQAQTMLMIDSQESQRCATWSMTAMSAWHLFVDQRRMERALDQMVMEQKVSCGAADDMQADLESARTEAQRERETLSEERTALELRISQVCGEVAEVCGAMEEMLKECCRLDELRLMAAAEGQQCEAELTSAQATLQGLTQQLRLARGESERVEGEGRARVLASKAKAELAALERKALIAEAERQREGRISDLREAKAQAKVEIAKHESMSRDIMETRTDDHSVWADELQQSELQRNKLEQELKSLQRSVIAGMPWASGLEAERQALQRRLSSAETRTAQLVADGSRNTAEFEALQKEYLEESSRCEELHSEVLRRRLKLEQRSNASAPATVHVEDLRAQLDGFQRAVRGPRGLSPPGSPTIGSQQISPRSSEPDRTGGVDNPQLRWVASMPTFTTARCRLESGDSLPSESVIQVAERDLGTYGDSPLQSTADINSGTVTDANASSIIGDDPWAWRAAATAGFATRSPRSSGSPRRRSQHEWSRGRTPSPPRGSGVDPRDGDGPQPRHTVITAARATAMWRQRTLTEHDAERRNLQERVAQMRRQIEVDRTGAPRRPQRAAC